MYAKSGIVGLKKPNYALEISLGKGFIFEKRSNKMIFLKI